MTRSINPYEFEEIIVVSAMITKEVMSDVDVTCELGRDMTVNEIDGGFVVFVNWDRTANELTRDRFDHVDDPK